MVDTNCQAFHSASIFLIGFPASTRFLIHSFHTQDVVAVFPAPFKIPNFIIPSGLPIYESRSDHSSFAARAVLRATLGTMPNWRHSISLGAEIPAAIR